MNSVIMFQGTGSGVGKSILTAGFCRLLANRGLKVAPFKAQNMALNSGVTKEGLEMGRAQILQADACRISPDVRMNPILLKPQGSGTSQLIRLGKVYGIYSYQDYYTLAEENFQIVRKAFHSLQEEYDWILLEGAGSPAEINLQKTDITNMRIAYSTKAAVFLIGDIDRGGVFAWMKGTYDLIQDQYKSLIQGFLINKFRGDYTLLRPGIEMFEKMVPVKVVGTLPYVDLNLEEEDSQYITSSFSAHSQLNIAVIRFPYLSNFTDFTALKSTPGINVFFVRQPYELEGTDLIILPGSKNTMADLAFLRDTKLYQKIQSLVGKTPLMGICGGYQMLGTSILDPHGVEGEQTSTEGFRILKMQTILEKTKTLESRTYEGQNILKNLKWSGYEIHMGKSTLEKNQVTQLTRAENLFVWNQKKKVLGTYIHGILDSPDVVEKILSLTGKDVPKIVDYREVKEQQLNRLAELIEKHCDLETILGLPRNFKVGGFVPDSL